MARPRKNDETGSPWVVRDVPKETRRKVRVYAAEHDMTMAEAITELVNAAHSPAPIRRPSKLFPTRPDDLDVEILRTTGYLRQAIFEWGDRWWNMLERPSLRQFLEAINAIRGFPLGAEDLDKSRAIFLSRLEEWTAMRPRERQDILNRESQGD